MAVIEYSTQVNTATFDPAHLNEHSTTSEDYEAEI